MINRIVRILLSISFAVACNMNINASKIPESLISFVKREFPNLAIISTEEYISGWNEFIPQSSLPFYCTSDLNGDNKLDHVLMLKGTNDNKLFLYVFWGVNDGYKSVLVDKFEPQTKGIQILINIEKKGEWESATDKITVPNDGIGIQLIEDSLNWSYYFNGKSFVKFLYD